MGGGTASLRGHDPSNRFYRRSQRGPDRIAEIASEVLRPRCPAHGARSLCSVAQTLLRAGRTRHHSKPAAIHFRAGMTTHGMTESSAGAARRAVDRSANTARTGSVVLVLLVAGILVAAAAGIVVLGPSAAEPYILATSSTRMTLPVRAALALRSTARRAAPAELSVMPCGVIPALMWIAAGLLWCLARPARKSVRATLHNDRAPRAGQRGRRTSLAISAMRSGPR